MSKTLRKELIVISSSIFYYMYLELIIDTYSYTWKVSHTEQRVSTLKSDT